jgi:outer membrane autotransporter protein
MRLPKLWAVVAGSVLLLAGAAAEAQAPPPVSSPTGDLGLNDVVSSLVSNNCAALSGDVGPYGPALAELCRFPPTGGGSSSGGTPASESRLGAAGAEQRLYRRLRERREAASTDVGRGLGIFFTADYEKFDQDSNHFESGFKRDTVGGTLGADYVLTRWLILGGAFNYGHEFGDYDDVGGGFDHDSYGFLLYASLLPTPLSFVDVVGGYARKDYGFERRVRMDLTGRLADGPTSGDTEGNEFRISVSGGYDFVFGNATVGPRLGVHYRDLSTASGSRATPGSSWSTTIRTSSR